MARRCRCNGCRHLAAQGAGPAWHIEGVITASSPGISMTVRNPSDGRTHTYNWAYWCTYYAVGSHVKFSFGSREDYEELWQL